MSTEATITDSNPPEVLELEVPADIAAKLLANYAEKDPGSSFRGYLGGLVAEIARIGIDEFRAALEGKSEEEAKEIVSQLLSKDGGAPIEAVCG